MILAASPSHNIVMFVIERGHLDSLDKGQSKVGLSKKHDYYRTRLLLYYKRWCAHNV